MKIAVLMTVYNRKEMTLGCLKSLYNCILPQGYKIDTFLVNDNCTDGTKEAIKEKYPQVNVIDSNGNLYWNGGMNLSWNTASKKNNYEFYLWLNDDVGLFKDSILNIISDYKNLKGIGIIVGSIKDPDSGTTSYGGYIGNRKLDPKGSLQVCETFNGNVVLVPRDIFESIGILDPTFTHAFGDTDYGWRARKAGFYCYVSSNYIAYGRPNPKGCDWANSNNSLVKRLKILHSPKGLPTKEWFVYSKRVYGIRWPISFLKIYLRVFFPSTWQGVKKMLKR